MTKSGIKDVDAIIDRLDNISGEHTVSFEELFTDDFIKRNSRFTDIAEFWNNSEFDFQTQEDFDSIPEKDLDQYVNQNTTFNSWEEMINEASSIYFSKLLNEAFS